MCHVPATNNIITIINAFAKLLNNSGRVRGEGLVTETISKDMVMKLQVVADHRCPVPHSSPTILYTTCRADG
jgi:hypothetical protein